ncbi:cation/H(+) antiporter 24-like [Salvia miltiorrhiza]|uniref:cation/H(+) antiporter 24-like n=1 Tax=Salvia miltiorrhiza TaxID=226208 RepID=UPI0025ABB1F9|nr:cation/H(+) antiporter 24-like [Salvia miltiorrhiza]
MTSSVNLTEPPELIKKGLVTCRVSHTDHPFGVFYGQNPLDFSFPLFLLQISTLILITRLLRFLLKPLRQPNVISEILGGIILGPSVLSRSNRFRAYIFPPEFKYVIKNVGLVGLIYFVFISAVKMDIMELKRAGKKHWFIAAFGTIMPIWCSVTVGLLQKKSMNVGLANFSAIWGISLNLSMAAFPVVYPIVRELNLLSSGIGRMALTTTMICDLIGVLALVVFEMLIQSQRRPIFSLFYLLSFIAVAATCVGGARHAMAWIVRSTPEEKPVGEAYITAVLVAVMVAGFVTDTFGLTVANGPMWLGLAVPTGKWGPPLGTALVEKMETIVRDILMPFSYMYIGLVFDIASVAGHWSHFRPLMLMVVSAYVVKMVSTFTASRLNHMSIRDSLTLSLLLGVKGQVDFLLFVHLNDLKILDTPHFTAMALSAATVTAVVTPLISILYDPTRPYLLDKRRNIQHSPPNAQLHILACIHSQENLSGLMSLLQVSNPTASTPLSVDALCLEELIGSNPVLIDHQAEDEDEAPEKSTVHNALKMFQEARGGDCLKIFYYTTITSRRTMYQDICELALANKACLVVLPLEEGGQPLNSEVLVHAPCSVAILVDRSPRQNLIHGALRSPMRHLALLFLGGADAREALAYADRMAGNPDVWLTVVRFLPENSEGDKSMEKKLDDGLVTQFWLKSEGKEQIIYREVVVKNGEETIAAIQGMDKQSYDLWIVGRKHGINPLLLGGLSNWSNENELGVIGEFIASADFNSRASVLAVQQQILRGQEKVSASLLRGFSLYM